MKAMTEQQGDYVGALIVDQMIKCILIKLDSVFGLKDKLVDKESEEFAEKVRVLKEACKRKLDLQLQGFEVKRKEYEQKIYELEKKIRL